MKRKFSDVEKMAMGLLVIFAIAWVMSLFGTRPKRIAIKTACLSNVKQLATALIIYSGEYGDRLPRAGWIPEIMPYVKNEQVLDCRLVAESEKRYGYAMNLAVMGAKLPATTNPEKTVLLFETDALGRGVVSNVAARNRVRHNRSTNVAYLDSHVKSIPKDREP